MTSLTTMPAMTPQKTPPLPLLLSIFLTLLAGDAQARVWQRVEAVEVDVLAAAVALPERLRRAVQPSQGFVDVPEKPTLLGREEKRLLALHRVRSLIGHVEGVRAQVAVRRLRRCAERLAVVAQLLQDTLPLLEQALLEVCEGLLGHGLRLLRAG